MINQESIDYLFWRGVELFNSGEYFDAHEEWEELWSEFNLPDRFFIQGLIQTTVSFYHLSTGNLKGSRNLNFASTPFFVATSCNSWVAVTPCGRGFIVGLLIGLWYLVCANAVAAAFCLAALKVLPVP